jgi:hypothetical protein
MLTESEDITASPQTLGVITAMTLFAIGGSISTVPSMNGITSSLTLAELGLGPSERTPRWLGCRL